MQPSAWRRDQTVDAGVGHELPTVPERSEVVVVGAGITGLTIAVELLRRGRDVTLVEAGSIAGGTTGRSTAKVTALHGLAYSRAASRRGPDTAAAYAAANVAGLAQLRGVVSELGVDVGWGDADAVDYATTDAGERSILVEAAAATDAGLAVELDDEVDLPFPVTRALRLTEQAYVDPVRLCAALARRCRGAGARVLEGCRVLDVERAEPMVVHTDRGRIRSDLVVLATLLPIVDPTLLFARVEPAMSYSMALRLRSTPPESMYLSVEDPTRSIRPAGPDGAILVGGGGHRVGEGGDTSGRAAELRQWAVEHFAVDEVLAQWTAHDLVPADATPFVGQVHGRGPRGLFVASGFQKWGFTNAGAAGLLIAGSIEGDPPWWAPAFDPRRRPTDPRSIATTVSGNLSVGRHFVGDRLATVRPPSVDQLEPGEGALCELDGTKVAAHRDADGSLTVRSARCPHMGCLVVWNAVDRSWDCPCHGSRFDVDGTVVAAPSTLGLTTLEAEEVPADEGPTDER